MRMQFDCGSTDLKTGLLFHCGAGLLDMLAACLSVYSHAKDALAISGTGDG